MSDQNDGGTGGPKDEHGKPRLEIFVNRRRFDDGDGVKAEMTGAQIAALVDAPADNAVVRREVDGKPGPEIGIEEKIPIRSGDRFLVTRKIVEGGHDGTH